MTRTVKPVRIMRKLFLLFLPSLTGLLFSSQLQANQIPTKDELRWYQIELIVFENRSFSRGAASLEKWSRDLLLAYPPGTQQLLTLEEAQKLNARTEEQENTANEPKTEIAFVDLGEEIFQLTKEKSAIDAERDMRVLVHKVWRQPVANRDAAESVAIIGGEEYDGHKELGGSISVSVNRYLHVDTDLWFTRFAANIGRDDNTWWPNLPDIPGSVSESEKLDNLYRSSAPKIDTIETPWLTNKDNEESKNRFGLGRLGPKLFGPKTETEQGRRKNYVIKEIVKIEQSRRMRSGELHYIDHPRVGLLVRIDTYKHPSASD